MTLKSFGFAGGDGSRENPYQVATAEDLNAVRNHLYAHCVQTADIDLDVAPWNEGAGWLPIGDDDDKFHGHFDGAGYRIHGLTINRPEAEQVGLFGVLAQGGDLLRVVLHDVSVVGGFEVGALCGWNDEGSIRESQVHGGTVAGEFAVGGLVGQNSHGALIAGSSAQVSVTGEFAVGGLVGSNEEDSQVLGSYASSLVEGMFGVGGLAGTNINGIVRDSYALGSVVGQHLEGPAVFLGGLVGLNGLEVWVNGEFEETAAGLIERSYASGWVSQGLFTGGLVGSQGHQVFITVIDDDEELDIGEPRDLGTIVDSFWNKEVKFEGVGVGSDVGATGLAADEMRAADAFVDAGWDVDDVWLVSDAENFPMLRSFRTPFEGRGIAEDPFLVGTAEQLNHVRNYEWAHFRQRADIDLGVAPWNEGAGWVPMFPYDWETETAGFAGVYDGDNFKIQSLTVDHDFFDDEDEWSHHEHGSSGGLFAMIAKRGIVRNVILEGGEVRGGFMSVAPLVGENFGTVENCHASTQAVHGNYEVGGLVGFNMGTIRTSSAVGSVQGHYSVGGLAGYNSGDIRNCFARGNVVGEQVVGGLVGANYPMRDWPSGDPIEGTGLIEFTYSTGSVFGTTDVGGLVGINDGDVLFSYWDTETSGQSASAGGQGCITAAMTFLSMPYCEYENWDFDNVWLYSDGIINDGYPYLLEEYSGVTGFTLSYTAGNGGSLTGLTVQTIEAGEDGTEVTAVPDQGAVFLNWSDGLSTASRTDTDVQSDLEVTAHFRSEGGVAIDWYADLGIAPEGDMTWADIDGIDLLGKGMTLREEFIAGTNPNDPQSRLAAIPSVATETGFEIHFEPNLPERRYSLFRSSDLVKWDPVPDMQNVPGGNGPMVDMDPPDAAAFYRIEVTLP